MKKKVVASILALFLGIWGMHRFYLGQKVLGIFYIAAFGVLMIPTALSDGIPFIGFVAILGLIDAILLLVMPREEFDQKYNSKYLYNNQPRYQKESRPHVRRSRRRSRQPEYGQRPRAMSNSFKVSGLEKYEDYDILGAMDDLRKALNTNFKDHVVHFYLACCYSINEEPEKALFHLDKAVDFGFVDFDKIHDYDALAYLRTHNRFEEFVSNSYQIPRYLPPEEDAQLNTMEDEKAIDILDQIAQLGALYEKGVLTPEEFQKEKQKLFSE